MKARFKLGQIIAATAHEFGLLPFLNRWMGYLLFNAALALFAFIVYLNQ